MKLPAKFQKLLPEQLNWVEKAAVVLIVAPVLGTALVGVPLLAGSLLWRKIKKGEETEAPEQLPPPPQGGDESDGE